MRRLGQIFAGLRFRLLLLVVLACSPLVALTIHTASEDRRRQVAEWQRRAEDMLQLASREEKELIGNSRQLLLAIAESSAVRSANRRDCKKLLDDLFASYPRYANLGVIRTNGDVLASAVPLQENDNQAEHPFFRKVLETRSFTIGAFPAAPGTNRPTLHFGHPVLDGPGPVRAVVFAALDLQWYNRFGSEISSQLPKSATWIEIDRKGTILSHYPHPESWIGRTLPDPTMLNAVLAGKNGVFEAKDDFGVRVLYAYVSMPSRLVAGEVTAILGIPRHELFAAADQVLQRNLVSLGVAVGLGLILGWLGSNLLIIRPVNALVRSSTRLASGDLRARTGRSHGRDELGQLTRAFDRMAEAIEQREAEQERANQKLQALSHKLVEVQESERRHLARELHDEIGQALTAAELNLQAALQSAGTPACQRRLNECIQAVEHVLEQVHDLSLNLRPSMLDDLGLEPALRWYTNRQANLAGLRVDFRAAPLDRRLDPVIETECFRVAQEALTNVVRHAKARSVAVHLAHKDGHIELSIRDDGAGFAVAEVRDRAVQGDSLGLLSMEERAALAGGGLEYISQPGQGTEVRAWFPMKWRDAQPVSPYHE